MYAVELSGVHVQRKVKLTYQFKNGKAYEKTGYLNEARHMAAGELWVKLTAFPTSVKAEGAFRIPYDAKVEFLNDN